MRTTPPPPPSVRRPLVLVALSVVLAAALAAGAVALVARTGEPDDTVGRVGLTDPADAAEVPESRAVIKAGRIHLVGAVPSRAASDEIEALAAEILGPGNVVNDYVVDERAGDPDLGNITVEDSINFAAGSTRLLPGSDEVLAQGLVLMAIRPAVTIEIVGHTDSRGTEADNQRLSQQRADEVKRWFVAHGIDESRLTASGAGESEPIADNSTEAGRRLNRRIQFLVKNVLGDG